MNSLIIETKNQIRSAWRFRWLAITLAWVIGLAGWAVTFIVPNQYKSSAMVYVDTESVLRPLLKGLAVQNDLEQRLRLMTRTLLSRANLETVIRETDLDHEIQTVQEREELLEKLRDTISIQTKRKQNFYTISYEYKDPYVAKKVVEVLLNIFVESALGDTRMEADTAQRFLEKQISGYETRLLEAEANLTKFKRDNVDTMPGQSGGIFQQLQKASTDLQDVELALKEAQIRRDEFSRQYHKTVVEEERRRREGKVVAETPTGKRLLAMETKLDELLLKYTERHPAVQELRETIKELKAQEARIGVVVSPASMESSTALEELKLAYRQSEVELTAIKLRASEYQRRVEELKQKLDTLPQVEAELTRLNRDYDINRENYQQLVQRLESARMSEQAEEAGDNVKFRIVEPPTVPLLPVGPKRLLLSIGVLLFSLITGGALAFIIAQLKPVYYDVSTLSKETEFPVFGQISRVWTGDVAMKRRIEVSGFMVAVFMLFCLFVIIVTIYQMGLREDIISAVKQNFFPYMQ